MSTLLLPPDEINVFNSLPAKVREEARLWMPWLARLLSVSRAERESMVQQASDALRVSPKTVRKRLTRANKLKGRSLWRACINGRKLASNKRIVPSEFIPFWQGLVLENKRCTKPAYDKLVTLWREGQPIPGYPASVRNYDLPEGLSYRNLTRAPYMPGEAQIALARHGIAEARKHLPHVLQDVSEVRPLEYIIFDDVELDFLILVPSFPAPVKLRLIVAMDLCSRVILGYGVRPAIPRPDGREDGLKLRDMKAVVARLLRTWGVPTGFVMHFICERGTAHLPDATKAALNEITGGQIIVHDTSMIVGKVFDFQDKSTGNSWGKAWLESFFNTLHNQLATVPGQKGLRYDRAPMELEGRKRELRTLMKAGQALPLDLRMQFRMPFLDCAEALQELDNVLARLHARTDHQLQGFDKVAVWRLQPGDAPKPRHELPDFLLDHTDKLHWQTRMESPMERFQRRITEVERREIHPSGIQRLMDEQARVRFADLQFAFTYDGTDYTYLVDDALLPVLQEQAHYLLWFHPHDMAHVYITRDKPHMGYIGRLSRFQRVKKGDLAAAKEAIRIKTHTLNTQIQTTQERGLDRLQRRAETLDINNEVLAEARRQAASLEIECDVIAPQAHPVHPAHPVHQTGDQAITADLAARAHARAEAERRAATTKAQAAKVTEAQLEDFLAQPAAISLEDDDDDGGIGDLL